MTSSKVRDDENAGTEKDDAEAVEKFGRTLRRMLETPPQPRTKKEKQDG